MNRDTCSTPDPYPHPNGGQTLGTHRSCPQILYIYVAKFLVPLPVNGSTMASCRLSLPPNQPVPTRSHCQTIKSLTKTFLTIEIKCTSASHTTLPAVLHWAYLEGAHN